jgi:hypothetical protein
MSIDIVVNESEQPSQQNINPNNDASTVLSDQSLILQDVNNINSNDITLKPNFYCCSLTVCYESQSGANAVVLQENGKIETGTSLPLNGNKAVFKNINLCEKYQIDIFNISNTDILVASTIYDPSKYIYWEKCY